MASIEKNKETARLFVRQVCDGRVDPALMTEDFRHWTAITGELSCDELNGVMGRVVSLFTSPFDRAPDCRNGLLERSVV